jgi:hypothetical protein
MISREDIMRALRMTTENGQRPNHSRS